MIRIIIIIAALLVGLMFGPEISENKGYILVSLDSYTTYETTIVNAIFIAIVFYFILLFVEWILRKLLSMNAITKGWFGQRKTNKAQKNTLLGMLALFEGNSKQAQKLLSKSADRSASPALTYIAAAKAAQQQKDYRLRDEYLEQATISQKGCKLAVGLVWVELQLEAQQYENAQANLNELNTEFSGNRRVAQLYLGVYPPLNEWDKFVEVLNKNHKSLGYSEEKFTAIQLDAYQNLFKQLALQEDHVLQTYWDKKSPRWMRKELQYQQALLDAYIEAGKDKAAEKFLLEKLNKQFSLPLLAYVEKLQITDHFPLISLLNKKLKKEPENGPINQALAKLKLSEEQEAAAIEHLKISVKHLPNSSDFALLANLLDKDDRAEEANEYYREGLLFAFASSTVFLARFRCAINGSFPSTKMDVEKIS
ncbi:MAG: heme biosynthesis HemY N-terminal domain-containing protein, partial [Psychromonas sp.]